MKGRRMIPVSCWSGAMAAVAVLLMLSVSGLADAQTRELDPRRSSFSVHVFKSGVFSAFGHEHDVRAELERGSITDESAVEVLVDARRLKVVDFDASEKDRAEVQQTMLGPTVLDSQKFPEIRFRSSAIEGAGDDRWRVRGELTLHGQSRPVTVNVALENGHYRGSITLRQTDFGITPVRAGGGTVKVKNEVRVDFDLVPR